MALCVTSIRRYPVKSMGGEELDLAQFDTRGLAGDRWFAVREPDGRLASGKDSARFRRHDEVFCFAARTRGFAVEVSGDGHTWTVGDPALDEHLSRRMGSPVSVRPERDLVHHDAAPLSLVGSATLAWWRERGIDADPRRLRTNLVLETVEPFVEEAWVGRELVVGQGRIAVTGPVARCRMVDVDQDGATGGDGWLRAATAERGGCVGMYARVVGTGAVRVGDRVRIALRR